MLETVDLHRIFDAVKERGYLACEVYAEMIYHCAVHLRDKWVDTRLVTNSGISLRCYTDSAMHSYVTSEATTKALLALLGEHLPAGTLVDKPTPPGASPFEKLEDKVAILAQVSRLNWSDTPAKFPSLRFEGDIKSFEVATSSDATITRGREESAVVVAEWTIEREGARTHHRNERCRASVEHLFEELRAENPFAAEVKRSFSRLAPWPVPRGEMPVLWSSRAVSQLCLPFLRAFEGDRVLGQRSFLNHLPPPFGLAFSVEENAPVEFDNEGSPTRPLVLFDGDRPKGLFVNNQIAHELSVASTGHCRRGSFQSAPTVLFWHPRIRSVQKVEEPLRRLEWGLSIRDVEILNFDPVSADVRVRLNDAKLIHHGEEGERVEPLEFDANLLELLRTWRCFSPDEETTGVRIAKGQQRFTTEISAPSALSESVSIPGQVPLQHYW